MIDPSAQLVISAILVVLGALQLAIPVLAAVGDRRHLRHLRRAEPQTSPPEAHLLVPCKGAGPHLRANVQGLIAQQYTPLRITFITESGDDGAVPIIDDLRRGHDHVSHVIAGKTPSGSQKIHNLLCGVEHATGDAGSGPQVFAFCDADICPAPDLVANLIRGLYAGRATVVTGYRWLQPEAAEVAARVHAVLSGYMATLIAMPRSRIVWGGTWAMRRADWERLQIGPYWRPRLSDDLALQTVLERNSCRREFLPECISPTAEAADSLLALLGWFSRQVFYMRLYTPAMWAGTVLSVLALVAGAVAAVATVVLALVVPVNPLLPAAGVVMLVATWLAALLIAVRHRRLLNFSPLWWPAAAPLVGLVAVLSAVRSIFMRAVTWGNITYTFNRDGTVRTIVHHDLAPAAADAAGSLEEDDG